MSDYAGAVAAIKSRFASLWVDGAARKTPIQFQNEAPNDGATPPKTITPWPPQDGAGNPIPWVYFEVIGNSSELRGIGLPGDNIWLYRGGIFVHVIAPQGYGVETSHALAVAAGEIFRAKTFYIDGLGAKVVCGAPQTDGGASDADFGNWFRITCFVPFEYFHRG